MLPSGVLNLHGLLKVPRLGGRLHQLRGKCEEARRIHQVTQPLSLFRRQRVHVHGVLFGPRRSRETSPPPQDDFQDASYTPTAFQASDTLFCSSFEKRSPAASMVAFLASSNVALGVSSVRERYQIGAAFSHELPPSALAAR